MTAHNIKMEKEYIELKIRVNKKKLEDFLSKYLSDYIAEVVGEVIGESVEQNLREKLLKHLPEIKAIEEGKLKALKNEEIDKFFEELLKDDKQ